MPGFGVILSGKAKQMTERVVTLCLTHSSWAELKRPEVQRFGYDDLPGLKCLTRTQKTGLSWPTSATTTIGCHFRMGFFPSIALLAKKDFERHCGTGQGVACRSPTAMRQHPESRQPKITCFRWDCLSRDPGPWVSVTSLMMSCLSFYVF